jgi:hypothetical protein
MSKYTYHHTVTVTSVGYTFPIDMLRYDGLIPATEGDSAKIGATFLPGQQRQNPISLSRTGPKDWTPTRRRWASFLWHVVDHRVVRR